ncbi:TonB-dependent receptor [Fulvivirga lutimaris]|uniref:TonB-dependent receptor n=1 Tax=Fulvivirga lutimaris TaxID=1819566 RepID=UPI0012BC7781|nr:TonB-dependent receptor plug domain-containing protein [Fulvivirga lutimaris]MTI40349.1 hypothetical protein [Fulvivirga lutimaris]
MKLIFPILLSFLALNFAFGQSENQKTLKAQLLELEEQFNVKFSFSDEIIDKLKVSDISIDQTLETHLEQISKQTGLAFDQVDSDVILISTVERKFCAQLIDQDDSKPLKGAQALFNDQNTNAISDDNGYMRFSGRFTFQDTVVLKYFGYGDKKLVIGDLSVECSTIQMSFSTTTLDEVVITHYITNGINAVTTDHSLVVSTKNLSLLPGDTDSDILLAIKTLPGISSPDGKSGNLHVRGSTSDQTLVLLDNIPIYHKGHYYGAISAFNPMFIDRVSVYRSGFDPSISGRVGGAITLESNVNAPDTSLYNISVNSLYASALASVPINKSWSATGSVRTSLPGSWQSPKLREIDRLVFIETGANNPNEVETESSFIYSDANFNTTYQSEKSKVSLSLLTINNDQELGRFNSQRNTQFKSRTELNNDGINISWNQHWSNKFKTDAFASYSHYSYDSKITELFIDTQQTIIPNHFIDELKDISIGLKNKIDVNPNDQNNFSFGYIANRYELEKDNFSARPNRPVISFEVTDVAYLHNLYFNQHLAIGNRLSINAGLTGLFYTVTDFTRVEPRVFANYNLNDHWSLKSSAGLYSQYVTQNVFFDFEDVQAENQSWELAKYNRPVVKSSLYMIGSSWSPSSFLIDIEGYYKEVTDLSTVDPNAGPNSPTPFTSGELTIFGIDLLLSKDWGQIDTWVSYSYTTTEMDFPLLNQLTFETYYDQPHTFNIGATTQINQWKFSLGWQYLSGIPVYTENSFFPVPGPDNDPNAAVVAEENNGRYDGQHQLDVAAVYQFPAKSKGWVGTVGLSLLNVYDQENLVSNNYITRGPNTSLETRYSIGFAPNLMLSIKW